LFTGSQPKQFRESKQCKALIDSSGKKYLKAKINELETKNYIKNIRISDFSSRTDIVKDERGDLVTDFHSILVM